METSLRRDGLPGKNALRLKGVKRESAAFDLPWYGCFLSLLMLCSIPRIGPAATALFLLPWSVLALRHMRQAVFSLAENAPLFLIPLLGLISIAWSQYPEFTLNASLQFIVTTMIAVWAGALVPARTFVSSLLAALTIINIAGLILDGGASFQGGEPLTGVFDSKNQLAFHALVQLLAALIVIRDREQPIIVRLVSLVAIALAPVCLIQAQSTGALVFGAPAILICLVLPFAARLSMMTRTVVIAAMLVTIAAGMIAVAGFVDDFGAVLDALGKDSTLTGRSYLWKRAHEFISAAPLLGVGYQAFWRPGNPPAEDLWAASFEESGAGFNFHNIYLHIGVDLGYIGMAFIIITMAWLALRLCRAIILSPDLPITFAMAMFAYMFTTSFIEAGFLVQFSLEQILFCVVWVYSGLRRSSYKRTLHPAKRAVMPQ